MKFLLSVAMTFLTLSMYAQNDAFIISNGLELHATTADICENADLYLKVVGGNDNQWSWTGPNGFTANVKIPLVTQSFNQTHVGTYIATYTAMNGVQTVVQFEVGMYGGTLGLGPDIEACANFTGTITANPGYQSYSWNTGEATESINVSINTSNTYSVTVTSAFGCRHIDELTVNVTPLSGMTGTVQITNAPYAGTHGDVNIDLTGGNVLNYPAKVLGVVNGEEYYFGDMDSSIKNFTMDPSSISNLRVVPSNACDTIFLGNHTIASDNNQDLDFLMDPINAGRGVYVYLKVPQDYQSYNWDTGDNVQALFELPSVSDVYKVTVTNANNESFVYGFPVNVIDFEVDYALIDDRDCNGFGEMNVAVKSNSTAIFPVELFGETNQDDNYMGEVNSYSGQIPVRNGNYTNGRFLGSFVCKQNFGSFSIVNSCVSAPLESSDQFFNGGQTISFQGMIQNTNEATIAKDEMVSMNAFGYEGKNWKWNGPNGFSGQGNEIIIFNFAEELAGTYIMIYEDAFGNEQEISFTLYSKEDTNLQGSEMADPRPSQEDVLELSLFPNPVSKVLNVKSKEATASIAGWTIVDNVGNKVAQSNFESIYKNEFSINVANLQAGSYQLISEIGDARFHEKFIITR